MAKDWFPIIDIGRCQDDCFKCLNFCPQQVYEKNGSKPKVENPDSCLKDCDACKPICPKQAISFITTRTVEIDGQQVGINGLDQAMEKASFEEAFELVKQLNYIPKDAESKYKETIRKEFAAKNI